MGAVVTGATLPRDSMPIRNGAIRFREEELIEKAGDDFGRSRLNRT